MKPRHLNSNSLNHPVFTLTIALVLILIPHLVHFPVWLSLLCLILASLRFTYDLGITPLPSKKLLLLFTILLLVGLFFSYQTLLGRSAGAALLMGMLYLKLFELHKLRDIAVISYLAFFSIIVSFLFNQSIFNAVLMIAAIILILTNLISHQHISQLLTSANRSWKIIKQHEIPHLKQSVRIILQALPLAIILFIIFPRLQEPLWGIPEDAHQAQTGLSDRMSPGRISQLSDSNSVAFRVKFDSAPPSTQYLYWRGPVLWDFDGFNWSAPQNQRIASGIYEYPANDKISYNIILEPHNNHWLFALDMPASIPDFSRLSTEMQVLSRQKIINLTRYNVSSYLDYFLPRDISLSSSRYLYLPEDSAPRARKLMQELTANKSQNETVKAVLNYFNKNPFYYSRTPPLLFDDPVDEFLFSTRRGYCEHFASTFTVLMRIAGIPSRIVTGYHGGEINPLDGFMTVRQSDAHAWSEVYLEDSGWTRIDPTSVIPVDRIESFLDIARLKSELPNLKQLLPQGWLNQGYKQARYMWDAVNNSWNQWVLGYDNFKQKSLFNQFGIKNINWQELTQLLFLLLTSVTLLLSWTILKPGKNTSDPLSKLYQSFLSKFKSQHLSKQQNEGELAFAYRASKSLPEYKKQIFAITREYQKLRYGKIQKTADVKIGKLKKAIKQFRIK